MDKRIRLMRCRVKQAKIDTYERCVLCWKITDVPKRLTIDLRENYIEGQGQLCRACYYRLISQTFGNPAVLDLEFPDGI